MHEARETQEMRETREMDGKDAEGKERRQGKTSSRLLHETESPSRLRSSHRSACFQPSTLNPQP